MDVNQLIGTHDVLLVTLDTLRYDVAVSALSRGTTPCLERWLPNGQWEQRHSPGNFTFAAHAAFFAGFLPTPAKPGRHPRLFAARFAGSETTGPETCVFDAPDIVTGLRQRGYHTVCIGGVGFFNKETPLGSVFPSLFDESHWTPELGVTNRHSTSNQVALANGILNRTSSEKRLFLFMNVSALHQPNRVYVDGATDDTAETQAAALAYVDSCFPVLFEQLRARGPCLCIICSDHGTAYGEDGYWGHRLSHPVVWTVPYAEFILPEASAEVVHGG